MNTVLKLLVRSLLGVFLLEFSFAYDRSDIKPETTTLNAVESIDDLNVKQISSSLTPLFIRPLQSQQKGSSFHRNREETKVQEPENSQNSVWFSPDVVSASELNEEMSNATFKAMEYLQELNASANQKAKHTSSNTSYLCSETFSGEEFYIRSPDYPLNYPSHTSCRYTIRRRNNRVCAIHFTVLRFDLGSNVYDPNIGRCPGDRIRIGNQLLCGRIRRGAKGIERFTSPSFKIDFRSGSGFGASGFLIKGRQVEECIPSVQLPEPLTSSIPCDRVISDRYFTIESPLFPFHYPHEVECRYEIIQAGWNVCGLLLTPSVFVVEGASYCMFDYMEIQGKRLCGNISSEEPLYYMFEESSMHLRFRTDESVTKQGFSLKGKQVMCNELEYFQPIHSPLASREHRIDSKMEEDLHDLQDISQTLSLLVNVGGQDKSASLRQPKTFFNEEGNEKTNFGFQQKYSNYYSYDDNPNNTFEDGKPKHEALVEFSESELITGTPIFVGNPRPNFNEIKYLTTTQTPITDPRALFEGPPLTNPSVRSPCNKLYSSEKFVITSLNYPKNYPDNLQCIYYIKRSSSDVCQMRFMLEDIDIERPSTDPDDVCSTDFIDIAGYRMCGTFKRKIVTMAFTGETVVVRFRSDSRASGRGYRISVEQLEEGCENRARKDSMHCSSVVKYSNFTIYSPGFPLWYPPNLWCTTTIFKANDSVNRMEIEFKNFDVEVSPDCQKDYLLIDRKKFCGVRSGNIYTLPFVGESVPITFVTDGRTSSAGFEINIRQVSSQKHAEDEGKCGGVFFSSSFTLMSPKYPSQYDPESDCVYTILRNSPDVCQLQFKMKDFDIEASPGCRRDFLQFGLRRFCGNDHENETHNYHFTDEKFSLIFHSDDRGSGKGFNIEVHQKLCQKPDDLVPPDSNELHQSFSESALSLQQFANCEQVGDNPIYNCVTAPSNFSFNNKDQSLEPQNNYFSNFPFPPYDGRFSTSDFLTSNETSSESSFQTTPEIKRNVTVPYADNCNWCKLYSFNKPYIINYSYVPHTPQVTSHLPTGTSNYFPKPAVQQNIRNPFKFQPMRAPQQYFFRNRNNYYKNKHYNTSPFRNYRVWQVRGGRNPKFHSRKMNFHPSQQTIVGEEDNHSRSPVEPSIKQFTSASLHRPSIVKATLLSKDLHRTITPPDKLFESEKNINSIETSKSSYSFQPSFSQEIGLTNQSITPEQSSRDSHWQYFLNHNSYLPPKATSNPSNKFPFVTTPPVFRTDSVTGESSIPQSFSTKESNPFIPPTPTPVFLKASPPSPVLLKSLHSTPVISKSSVPAPKGINSLNLQGELPNFSENMKICNKSITLNQFQLRSPGFPGPFYTDMHCYYFIHRSAPSRCGLLMTIDILDMPGAASCQSTFLSVAGRRFCGTKPDGLTMVVPFSPKFPTIIEFRSDKFHSGAGFSLSADQIECENFSSYVPASFHKYLDAFYSKARNPNTFTPYKTTKFSTARTHSKSVPNILLDFPSNSQNSKTFKKISENRKSDETLEQFLNIKSKPFNQHGAVVNANPTLVHSHARGHVSVPWVGVKGGRFPRYGRVVGYMRNKRWMRERMAG